jgi:hypothetical protein
MHLYAMLVRQSMSKLEPCNLEGNLGCSLPRSRHILSPMYFCHHAKEYIQRATRSHIFALINAWSHILVSRSFYIALVVFTSDEPAQCAIDICLAAFGIIYRITPTLGAAA